MMKSRRGLGRGKGRGYKNIVGKDPKVHSESARGRKQPQRLKEGAFVKSRFTDAKGVVIREQPFAVKYIFKGKVMARESNPKFWEKKNLKDTDGDKTPDVVDCEPNNPLKQDKFDLTSLTSAIIQYEQGEMSDKQTLKFFARIIKLGLVWRLQGHYGRTATALIDDGFIESSGKLTEKGKRFITEGY